MKHRMTATALKLIENGADVNARSSGQIVSTPLEYTLWSGLIYEEDIDIIALPLIAKVANVNDRISSTVNTPLHSATTTKIAQALIDRGADIHAKIRNESGWDDTPLDIACYLDRTKVAIVLLENGAAADIKLGHTAKKILCRIHDELTPKCRQAIATEIIKCGGVDKWMNTLATHSIKGDRFNDEYYPITDRMKFAATNIFIDSILHRYSSQYTEQKIHGNPAEICLRNLTSARAADKADEVPSLTTLCVRKILELDPAKLFSAHISALADAHVVEATAALGSDSLDGIDE